MSEQVASVASDEGQAIGGDSDVGSTGKRIDPGFKRNIMVIGLVFVVAIVVFVAFIMVMRGGTKTVAETTSSITIQEGAAVHSSDGLTPAMREKLTRAQERESREAGARGQSYIPPDIIPEKNEPLPQALPAAPQQGYAQPVSDPNRDRRNQERLQAAQGMLSSMLQRPASERVTVARIEPAAAASAPVAAASAAPALEDRVVVDIMEIFGARLSSPVDTDASSFASAEITTGRLAGAQLIGTVKLVGTGVEFKFTGMRHEKRTYPINAIALDEQTSTSAVRGELDRKMLTRFVFPVLMAYGGAYATAKAQVETTTTSLGFGSIGVGGANDYGVTRPAPTDAQARAAGVAAGVQIGNQVVGKGAAEPVRVTINSGVGIGVMFRDEVKASQSNTFKTK